MPLLTHSALVRVLMVEDHPGFRQFISSALANGHNLQIISEAHDGLDAVEQAEKLQPDLILLDIGLPKLNGVEAARRILKVAPRSKIVFLTQETATDIVHEAFRLGASGYVLKTDAESDLLSAMYAVMQGENFVSGGLSCTI